MNKMERKAAIKRRNHNKLLHKLQKLALSRDHVDNGTVDRISRLPDVILVSILSRLPLKEAIATSSLSASWRHLYTFVDRLNFPPFKIANARPLEIANARYSIHYKTSPPLEAREEFSRRVTSIDRTLDSCTCTILKEFSVEFIDCLEGANIEKWLDFALSREVETINMHMRYVDPERFNYDGPSLYALRLSNLIGGRTLPGLETLKKLSLWGVGVEDSEIELLLSSFPLLESLSISVSKTLKNVSVVGSGDRGGLMLSRLDIYYAVNLRSVEIRDMLNLVCFECFGNEMYAVDVRLSNVPKLTEFRVSKVRHWFLPRPCYVSEQMQLFNMWMYVPFTMICPSHEPLRNLRRIEIKVYMDDPMYIPKHSHRLQKLFPLIEACCALETLEIEFLWGNYHGDGRNTYVADVFPTCPITRFSPSLKKMVFSGYIGTRMEELTFALLIMDRVRALEQLTVIPCDVSRKVQKMATARAWMQFKPFMPNSVNLLII